MNLVTTPEAFFIERTLSDGRLAILGCASSAKRRSQALRRTLIGAHEAALDDSSTTAALSELDLRNNIGVIDNGTAVVTDAVLDLRGVTFFIRTCSLCRSCDNSRDRSSNDRRWIEYGLLVPQRIGRPFSEGDFGSTHDDSSSTPLPRAPLLSALK